MRLIASYNLENRTANESEKHNDNYDDGHRQNETTSRKVAKVNKLGVAIAHSNYSMSASIMLPGDRISTTYLFDYHNVHISGEFCDCSKVPLNSLVGRQLEFSCLCHSDWMNQQKLKPKGKPKASEIKDTSNNQFWNQSARSINFRTNPIHDFRDRIRILLICLLVSILLAGCTTSYSQIRLSDGRQLIDYKCPIGLQCVSSFRWELFDFFGSSSFILAAEAAETSPKTSPSNLKLSEEEEHPNHLVRRRRQQPHQPHQLEDDGADKPEALFGETSEEYKTLLALIKQRRRLPLVQQEEDRNRLEPAKSVVENELVVLNWRSASKRPEVAIDHQPEQVRLIRYKLLERRHAQDNTIKSSNQSAEDGHDLDYTNEGENSTLLPSSGSFEAPNNNSDNDNSNNGYNNNNNNGDLTSNREPETSDSQLQQQLQNSTSTTSDISQASNTGDSSLINDNDLGNQTGMETECEGVIRISKNFPSIFAQAFFSIVYVILFIFGMLGNTMTLCALRRKFIKLSTMDIFIANLALSDLMLCVFAVPITSIYLLYLGRWTFGLTLCKMITSAQAMSVYISTLTMLCIAYVRFQMIVHPHRKPMTKRQASSLCVGTWIACVLITLPYQNHVKLLPENCPVKFCDERWDSEQERFQFSLLTLIIQLFLPFVSISYLYGKIFWKLRNQKLLRERKQNEQQQGAQQQQNSSSSSNNRNNNKRGPIEASLPLTGSKSQTISDKSCSINLKSPRPSKTNNHVNVKSLHTLVEFDRFRQTGYRDKRPTPIREEHEQLDKLLENSTTANVLPMAIKWRRKSLDDAGAGHRLPIGSSSSAPGEFAYLLAKQLLVEGRAVGGGGRAHPQLPGRPADGSAVELVAVSSAGVMTSITMPNHQQQVIKVSNQAALMSVNNQAMGAGLEQSNLEVSQASAASGAPLRPQFSPNLLKSYFRWPFTFCCAWLWSCCCCNRQQQPEVGDNKTTTQQQQEAHQKNSLHQNNNNHGPNHSSNNNTVNDILALKEQRQREKDKRLRQTNRKLLCMVVVFVCAWLPLNMFNLIQDYFPAISDWAYLKHAFITSHLLACSSVCCNPILYAWMSDNYRQEMEDLLPKWLIHLACNSSGNQASGSSSDCNATHRDTYASRANSRSRN